MTHPRRRGTVTCAHCGRLRTHHGRGLCSSCCHGWNGCNPADYERTTFTSAELVAEYQELVFQGYTRRTAAERLGITLARLEKAIQRQNQRLEEAS